MDLLYQLQNYKITIIAKFITDTEDEIQNDGVVKCEWKIALWKCGLGGRTIQKSVLSSQGGDSTEVASEGVERRASTINPMNIWRKSTT
jgi:hypothetical protein